MTDTPIDHTHTHTDVPICPHCGHPDNDHWEHQGEDWDHDCGSCGKEYRCSRNTTVSFTTSIPTPSLRKFTVELKCEGEHSTMPIETQVAKALANSTASEALSEALGCEVSLHLNEPDDEDDGDD